MVVVLSCGHASKVLLSRCAREVDLEARAAALSHPTASTGTSSSTRCPGFLFPRHRLFHSHTCHTSTRPHLQATATMRMTTMTSAVMHRPTYQLHPRLLTRFPLTLASHRSSAIPLSRRQSPFTEAPSGPRHSASLLGEFPRNRLPLLNSSDLEFLFYVDF